ncbi:MAG: hypothetical protein ACAH80_17815 [Alphaproteobacteria bacterium]
MTSSFPKYFLYIFAPLLALGVWNSFGPAALTAYTDDIHIFAPIVVVFVIYGLRKKTIGFFEKNPLPNFWNTPAFMELPDRAAYELVSCAPTKNPQGIANATVYGDEKGAEIAALVAVTATDIRIRVGTSDYSVHYQAGAAQNDMLLCEDGNIVATYTRRGGKPAGRVAFENGELAFFTPNGDRISPPKKQYWRDAEGNILAMVYRPSMMASIIAVRKDMSAHMRAAVLAFLNFSLIS